MNTESGFVLLHRSIEQTYIGSGKGRHKLVADFAAYTIFTRMIMWANHKRVEQNGIAIERGCFAMSLTDMEDNFYASRDVMRRVLKALLEEGMIKKHHDSAYHNPIYEIMNYDKFQVSQHGISANSEQVPTTENTQVPTIKKPETPYVPMAESCHITQVPTIKQVPTTTMGQVPTIKTSENRCHAKDFSDEGGEVPTTKTSHLPTIPIYKDDNKYNNKHNSYGVRPRDRAHEFLSTFQMLGLCLIERTQKTLSNKLAKLGQQKIRDREPDWRINMDMVEQAYRELVATDGFRHWQNNEETEQKLVGAVMNRAKELAMRLCKPIAVEQIAPQPSSPVQQQSRSTYVKPGSREEKIMELERLQSYQAALQSGDIDKIPACFAYAQTEHQIQMRDNWASKIPSKIDELKRELEDIGKSKKTQSAQNLAALTWENY